MLKSQGMQMNQAVTFLSDGGDTDLQMYLNPQAEHLFSPHNEPLELLTSASGY
jgi:hypothetical protein